MSTRRDKRIFYMGLKSWVKLARGNGLEQGRRWLAGHPGRGMLAKSRLAVIDRVFPVRP